MMQLYLDQWVVIESECFISDYVNISSKDAAIFLLI